MVGAILIGFLHSSVSTGYLISHNKIKNVQLCKQLWHFKIMVKVFFPARTKSSEISNFGNIFCHIRIPPPFGAIWIPLFFFQTKTGISVSSMVTIFSILSSIFKTWTMLNAVQANLLVSQKVVKGALDGAILIRGHLNLEQMFRLCLNFYLDILFSSSEISSHACFKL